jgi:hypothetical protein
MSAALIIAKHVEFCMMTNHRHKLNFYNTHLLFFNFDKAHPKIYVYTHTGNSHNGIRRNK